MLEVRHNVKLAVTWRILAELTRRHPGAFRILETHPCSGQYDCISLLVAQGEDPFAQHLCDFHVPAQHFHVSQPIGVPQTRLSDLGWPDTNDYVLSYLSAEDPKQVVGGMEQVLGLPPHSQAPRLSPASLVIQTMAAAIERFVLSRKELDVHCGWFDSSHGASPTSWALALPDVREGLAALPEPAGWRERAKIAARIWQIKVHAPSKTESGVLLDMKTGTAHARGEIVSLTRLYHASGRRVAPLADWVAERIVEGATS